MKNKSVFLLNTLSRFTVMAALLMGISGSAEDSRKAPTDAAKAERLTVENIKEKYWAKGEEQELRVVQNRTYTKSRKFEVGVFAGAVATDPFLSVKNFGGLLGFHFNEYFEASILYWKYFVKESSALEQFRSYSGTTTNTNEPKSFFGGELAFSPIYGKLSILGQAIIYYDFHLLGGLGSVKTESGNYASPFVGIGQQIYISKFWSVRLDYRVNFYKENILEKVKPATLGTKVGDRTNTSSIVTLGINVFVDLFNSK